MSPEPLCRAPRNRTLTLTELERLEFRPRLTKLLGPTRLAQIRNRTINQNLTEVLSRLPEQFADLLFLDPPYNLTKAYNGNMFAERAAGEYRAWFESWFIPLLRTLKSNASVYVCADWRSSGIIQPVLEARLKVRTRITWEREKGRGARMNWKNCTEDIWFCTVSDDYYFDVGAVKLRRRVIAPYTDSDGRPRDWTAGTDGDTRDTHPSNIWTDVTVPFWSMPENTEHPAQKPEKLLAKIVLASCPPDGVVLDPFLGSGTTSVVAKKLGRSYVGIEQDTDYCCLAEKRLALAEHDRTIQGYADGVFWERNSAPAVRRARANSDGAGRAGVMTDGTTLLAAAKTGRNSIGIDIDPAYCRMAERRLERETRSLFGQATVTLTAADEAVPASRVMREASCVVSDAPRRGRKDRKQ